MMLKMTPFRRGLVAFVGIVGGLVAVNACGSAEQKKATGATTKITVTPAATGLNAPIDATPDPMGTDIYFLATGPDGPTIFHVAATSGTPMVVFAGAPLVAPHGISISSDGKTLYVADPTAGMNGGGAIFSLPSSGDTPVPVAGSEGTHPTALDLAEVGKSDDIYFTGADMNGDAAVYELPAAGGVLKTLASGAPLAKPDGIAVSSMHTVYVADKQAGMTKAGQVFSLAGAKPATLGPEVTPGDPMGMAITLDDSKLLVSSLDEGTGTSEVNIIATKGGAATVFNDVIKQNTVSGGVHRARFKDVYAWAGKTQVYSIKIKISPIASSSIGGAGVN